jgi:uncharacterized membrane protein YfcA
VAVIEPMVIFLTGLVAGVLSVLAGGGVSVVLPVLLALGLTADQANATSRFNLTIGALIATVILINKKKIEWKTTYPLLVATVIGAIGGSWLGTMLHSTLMLAIIVSTSAISMVLVYMKPSRWLSTADTGRVVPESVGAFLYFLLCFYGGIVAVDSAILRLIVLVLLLGLPLSKANPIKVVTGLALFGISSLIYGEAGKVDWGTCGWLTAGTAIGAYAASIYAASDDATKWVYLLLQIIVTIETLLLLSQWLGWISWRM